MAAFGGTGLRTAYAWDAENRLIRVGPVAGYEMAGDLQVTISYDYMSRRVAKRVYTYAPNASPVWVPTKDRRFIWDGWVMLRELEGGVGVPPASPTTVATYLWGLDLAGQMGAGQAGASHSEPRPQGSGSFAAGHGGPALQGAGGIGGLIAVNIAQPEPSTPGGTFIYCYDANGNVTQIVDPAGTEPNVNIPTSALKAHYEYTPYGDLRMTPAGTYAATNAWRFSTKPFDPASGLGYWGERYYSATLGRWMSRDPITEEGGPNVQIFVSNSPVLAWDGLGLFGCTRPNPSPPPIKPIKPKCTDCESRCHESGAQTALGTDEGGVVCFPDGCVCPCANDTRLPPGSDRPSVTAARECVRQHEDEHVKQQGSGLIECISDTKKGGPPRGGFPNPGSDRKKAECPAWGVELECLASQMASCPDGQCRSEVEERMRQLVRGACGPGAGLNCSLTDLALKGGVALPASVAKQVSVWCK